MCACLKRVFSSMCGGEMVVFGHVFCLCVLVALQAKNNSKGVGVGSVCLFS